MAVELFNPLFEIVPTQEEPDEEVQVEDFLDYLTFVGNQILNQEIMTN